MRKLLVVMGLTLTTSVAMQAQANLKGFSYDKQEQPTGQEWQSPEAYAHGKLQPRAHFYSFKTVSEALGVLPEKSSYYQSLNGAWRFHWVGNPEEREVNFFKPEYNDEKWDTVNVPMSWNIYGLQKDGKQKYGTPIYLNQRVPFFHQVKVDDWKGGVMRTPPENYTMYKHRNEVGAYRRTFTVPSSWEGQSVYVNFDGVDSFFYIWVNGHYVGFSKNSRNRASFDISPYLKQGENTLAVEVYRNNDGSFLESQDMFRLPGIFRSVSLTAKPKVQIHDLQITPDLDATYQHATLNIKTDLRSYSSKLKQLKGLSLRYSLYSLPLYLDEGAKRVAEVQSEALTLKSDGAPQMLTTSMPVESPNLWSAEAPYRYILVGELLDKKGNVLETVSTYTGIRKVELKEMTAEEDEFGLAGRYFLINGKPAKLKGVNRHETHPATGHALTHEMMEEEVRLMKRANINHVRNSHYPTDPYFYYLCDKYGIYLEDEANIESHEYYYGKESLSHVKEFDIQTTNRMLEMVYSDFNHPSIVIWSLGNEAGPGDNFKRSYAAAKAVDASRPIQYERNNDIVDIGSNQYPSIPWVQEAVKGKYKIKYPFHISEYAHSMGNAVGGLQDYWTAIESTNHFCGGAIWDWVDQSMYNYLPNGKRYLAYGGDFGDTPNDGMFVMNGILFADRTPKPQYFEVDKVYQNVGFSLSEDKKTLTLFNKNYYTDLSPEKYSLRLSLLVNGVETAVSFPTLKTIAPRSRATIEAKDLQTLLTSKPSDAQAEVFIKAELRLNQDMPWAQTGFIVAREQFLYSSPAERQTIASLAKGDALSVKENKQSGLTQVSGKGFTLAFDNKQGTIHSLKYGSKTIIAEGNGPKLDAFRAAADNDNWAYDAWGKNGLYNLKHKAISNVSYKRADGAQVFFYLVESQAPYAGKIGRHKEWPSQSSGRYFIEDDKNKPMGADDFKFTTAQSWIVYPDGSIELQANIVSSDPKLALARLGYELVLPKEYGNLSYYGRGPENNYSDRKTSQFIGQYTSTVKDMFVDFPKPQTMGNREDVRWIALYGNDGEGVLFQAGDKMSTSALPWSAKELLLAPHPHELPEAGDTHLHLDASVNGLGGNSCGQGGPLKHCRSFGEATFSYVIRPFAKAQSADKNALNIPLVRLSASVPPIISRDNKGEVVMKAAPGDVLMYRIGKKGKAQTYTAPFVMRDAAEITVWSLREPKIQVTQMFNKITTVPLEVIYASSQESGGGDAKHLVDGRPESIWHTMYSVTVAQYPHWIDFDASEVRLIKGFTFLPRTDASTNGDIKNYLISVSLDGKKWEEIHQGEFTADKSLKRVTFAKPIKARYVRFTALSSRNGADYAAGAEFSLVAD